MERAATGVGTGGSREAAEDQRSRDGQKKQQRQQLLASLQAYTQANDPSGSVPLPSTLLADLVSSLEAAHADLEQIAATATQSKSTGQVEIVKPSAWATRELRYNAHVAEMQGIMERQKADMTSMTEELERLRSGEAYTALVAKTQGLEQQVCRLQKEKLQTQQQVQHMEAALAAAQAHAGHAGHGVMQGRGGMPHVALHRPHTDAGAGSAPGGNRSSFDSAAPLAPLSPHHSAASDASGFEPQSQVIEEEERLSVKRAKENLVKAGLLGEGYTGGSGSGLGAGPERHSGGSMISSRNSADAARAVAKELRAASASSLGAGPPGPTAIASPWSGPSAGTHASTHASTHAGAPSGTHAVTHHRTDSTEDPAIAAALAEGLLRTYGSEMVLLDQPGGLGPRWQPRHQSLPEGLPEPPPRAVARWSGNGNDASACPSAGGSRGASVGHSAGGSQAGSAGHSAGGSHVASAGHSGGGHNVGSAGHSMGGCHTASAGHSGGGHNGGGVHSVSVSGGHYASAGHSAGRAHGVSAGQSAAALSTVALKPSVAEVALQTHLASGVEEGVQTETASATGVAASTQVETAQGVTTSAQTDTPVSPSGVAAAMQTEEPESSGVAAAVQTEVPESTTVAAAMQTDTPEVMGVAASMQTDAGDPVATASMQTDLPVGGITAGVQTELPPGGVATSMQTDAPAEGVAEGVQTEAPAACMSASMQTDSSDAVVAAVQTDAPVAGATTGSQTDAPVATAVPASDAATSMQADRPDMGVAAGIQTERVEGAAALVQTDAADAGVATGMQTEATDAGVATGMQTEAADAGVATGMQTEAADAGVATGMQTDSQEAGVTAGMQTEASEGAAVAVQTDVPQTGSAATASAQTDLSGNVAAVVPAAHTQAASPEPYAQAASQAAAALAGDGSRKLGETEGSGEQRQGSDGNGDDVAAAMQAIASGQPQDSLHAHLEMQQLLHQGHLLLQAEPAALQTLTSQPSPEGGVTESGTSRPRDSAGEGAVVGALSPSGSQGTSPGSQRLAQLPSNGGRINGGGSDGSGAAGGDDRQADRQAEQLLHQSDQQDDASAAAAAAAVADTAVADRARTSVLTAQVQELLGKLSLYEATLDNLRMTVEEADAQKELLQEQNMELAARLAEMQAFISYKAQTTKTAGASVGPWLKNHRNKPQ